MIQHECHNCGKELEPPRTKWCSDRCRMRFKRQGRENGASKTPPVVLEMETEKDEVASVKAEHEPVEAAETMTVLKTSGDKVNRKMVAAEQYNAVVVKNRELAVHVDLLVEERDKLTIQLGATQDRLISAERDAAANAARLERIPQLEAELSTEREIRRDAERSMSSSDAKLEQMIRLEADLANERVAHADTKRKYLDVAAAAAPTDEFGLNGQDGSQKAGSPVSAGENAKPGIRIAPSYRQNQLSNFVILLLLGVIILLAALVIRSILGVG